MYIEVKVLYVFLGVYDFDCIINNYISIKIFQPGSTHLTILADASNYK